MLYGMYAAVQYINISINKSWYVPLTFKPSSRHILKHISVDIKQKHTINHCDMLYMWISKYPTIMIQLTGSLITYVTQYLSTSQLQVLTYMIVVHKFNDRVLLVPHQHYVMCSYCIQPWHYYCSYKVFTILSFCRC